MRQSFNPYKQHISDFLLIIVIIGFGFILGQILSISILKFLDPALFQEMDLIKESHDMNRINVLKFIQFMSAFCTFVLPSFVIGKIFGNRATSYLSLNRTPDFSYYFFIVVFMLSVMPLMNVIIDFNENLKFPEWMSGLEERLRSKEDSSQSMIRLILSGDRYFDLLINIIVIAALPALGEELLFRGILQKYFTSVFKNPHFGILLSAVIFSAIHFQFFGFVPRFLLGALFGYLVYFSGSLWTAIWAHFFNNALAVTAMFFISKGDISVEIENFGTRGTDIYYIVFGCIIALFVGYKLFKHSWKN